MAFYYRSEKNNSSFLLYAITCTERHAVMSDHDYSHLDRLLSIIKQRIGPRWKARMVKPRFNKRVKDVSGFYAVGKYDDEFLPRVVLVSGQHAFHYFVYTRDVLYVDLTTQQLLITQDIPAAVWTDWRNELHRLCDAEYDKRQAYLSSRKVTA